MTERVHDRQVEVTGIAQAKGTEILEVDYRPVDRRIVALEHLDELGQLVSVLEIQLAQIPFPFFPGTSS